MTAIRSVRSMSSADRAVMGRRGRRFAEEHLSVMQFQAALVRVYDSLQGKTAAAR